MLSKLKHTAKQTIIYSLGNLSLKLVGIVLLPLYTSYLSTTDYGALILLETTSLLLVSIFSFKLPTAMMRWCSQEDDETVKKTYVFTNYFFSVLIIILINVICYPFYDSFSVLLWGERTYSYFFPVLFLSASFEILNLFPLELIRLNEKSVYFVILSVVRLILVLTANIILIVVYNYGILGVLIAQAFGHIVIFTLTLPLLISNMRLKLDLNEFRSMFKYGFPLVFSALAMMLLNVGDRYIIKYLLDFSQVAIYSLGYQISTITNMFIIKSFQTGFLPIAYKMHSQKGAGRFFSKTLTYYVFVLSGFSLAISVFAKEIVELFSRDASYYSAYTVVPFFALAFMLSGIQYFFSLSLHFVKKTHFNALIVTSIAIINIILNFIFIPIIGIYGAAGATIVCSILLIVFFYLVAQKFYPVHYEILKILLMFLLFILILAVSTVFNEEHLLIRVPVKLLLVGSFPFLLKLFPFYEEIEIVRLKEFWFKFRNEGIRGFLPK